MNLDTFEKLQLNEVKELVKINCVSSHKVEKGIILEVTELISCEDFLRGCRKIKGFMLDKEFYSPTLSSYALNITECESIEEEIKFSIKNNQISSEASKELKKIRRNIEICEGRIKEKLNKFLTSSTNKKYIQEFIISKRDDRFVIPIKSSFKNEVDGTILDTSSKGSTVFIEPASISKYSLELITLKSEEAIEEYKILSYLTELIYDKKEIKFSIKNNKISSEASRELKKIRRNIEICECRIKEKLNKFLTSSTNKKYIQEFIISKRDDRFVVPIKSSFKNEVDGTILDTSSKGSTVFIEPASISKYSLELITLKSEEAIEEYKILSYLTELIYDKITEIKLNMEIVSEYDMVFAKAKFSQNNKCITPKINNHGYTKIIKGKHPLLKGNVIPLDFEIGDKYRSLIITGPNAGGKTVTLKTVGLLTLMTQCGFDIPAEENTEISIFERVFVDIGDNQSIENALSTFSSHIKNIANIMKEANKNTLVLFDEIGSGTDPNEGASLAIALLEEFYQMGCITIASTHYEEIKHFANKHPHFENAGMMFDKETLEPLYKLIIGKSEDSNALFISRKMGIKENVLQKAKSYRNQIFN